jgi:hypothetical protein
MVLMAPGLVSWAVVLDEQQVDHQANHLARGEVLARCLVGQLGELPDQLLVQVAHLEVGHLVGVQVDLGELGHHQVEQLRAVQPVDLGGEVELVEHVAGRGGEAGDVVLEVVGQVVGGGDQRGEVEPGGVVELLAGLLLEDRVEVVTFFRVNCTARSSTACLVGSSTQSNRRSTVRGRITLPYSDCL